MSSLLQVGFLDVNEGGDPKDLPPGTLVKADNCAMDDPRRLMKRKGTTGLVKTALSGSNIAAGKRFLITGDNTAVTDGQTAWAYVGALSKWNPLDRIPSWRVTSRPLVDSTRSVILADIAIYGSMLITAYNTAGTSGLYVQIDDVNTGAVVLPATRISSSASSYPRILVSGSKAYVICSESAEVTAITINLATFALTDTPLVSDSAAVAGVIDAVIGTPTGGVPTLYIVYELDTGTDRTKIASFTLSTLAAITTVVPVLTANAITCACLVFGDLAQKLTLIWSTDSTDITQVFSCNPALGSTVGPTQVTANQSQYVFAAEDSATNLLLGWTRNSAAGDGVEPHRLTTALFSVAAHTIVTSSRRITFGLNSATKPWRTSNRWFVGALAYVHGDTFPNLTPLPSPSTVVVEVETSNSLTGIQDSTHPHVATLENQTGWYSTGQTKPAVDADGNIWIASPSRDREPIGYAAVPRVPLGWSVFRLALSEGDTFRCAHLGSASLCAGGAPVWFDGASAMPYGFAHAPQLVAGDASGNTMVAGTYSYVATFAWRDAGGLLHRSIPSPPYAVEVSGNNLAAGIQVSTSSISGKQRTLTAAQSANPVFVELWRTTVGGAGPHYRLSLEPDYQVLLNDPQAGVLTITDTKPDSNIASGVPEAPLAAQEQLYTDLGELANVPPPAFITTAIHKNRIVGIAGDRHTVWLSKDSTEDLTQAPGFNEALTLTFADEKTALASLNTTLVVFGEDGIDIVHGDGPDATGSGAWQTQRVQTDLGCTEPRSVVTTPMGVMFLSARGLELMDVGLNVVWLGERIKDTIATYPTITSATLVASEQEVRFTCTNGSSGIVLAYDYGYKVWFVRRYKDSADTAASNIAFVDAALIDGVYTMLTAGGQVYRETTSHKLDNGADFVAMDVILAPISAQPGRSGWSNANLGWTRMKDVTLMGTSVTNHNITVSTALDYANSYGYTKTFAAGGAVTATGPLEKCRATPPVQKCQAIQIRIQDATPTDQSTYPITTGDGPILEAVALRISPLTGPAKTAAGQQG